jgi:hypothetical protein
VLGGVLDYPTRIGTVHPDLAGDFTGELARALKDRGLRG